MSSQHRPAPSDHEPDDAAPRTRRPHRRDRRGRFVTACQQLLVLGVICAGLTPAARVVSLELGPQPDAGAAPSGEAALPPLSMAAYSRAQTKAVAVPSEVVDPTVREVSLTAPAGARVAPGSLAAASNRVVPTGESQLVSEPQQVTGYGAVGLTWQHGDVVPDDQIAVEVRTRDEAGWSDWLAMEYHDDHGPDPDSREGRRARPGTDELLVGEVDQVQVKVVSDRPAPADLRLAVIDPGVAEHNAKELPAIDTGAGDAAPAVDTTQETSEGDLALAAGRVTPKPVIYSRAQWGANEKLRDKGSLHYYEVHAGFVHHTVNANNYKAADVPAILRGIYAYHTQSRGWSDVGYNYLVDRFGRIWEGRYGGVDRPVVGAHTLGYNDDAFAMSAIGNFEEARPSRAMIQAYGALFGWKLSLHGINASSSKQFVTSRNFAAINGHRDAASTACPGKYLYAKIPQIRTLARQAQVGFAGRQLESNLAAGERPDIVVRRASDGQGFVVPIRRTRAGLSTGKPRPMKVTFRGASRILNAGDWDRDGRGDVINRRASDGKLFLRRGLGNGKFAANRPLATGFKTVGLLAAVGDMTGDGWPDLMGQPRGGSMRIYPGRGLSGLKPSYAAFGGVQAGRQIPVGLWTGDGAPDSLFRNGRTLKMHPGNGPGGLMGGRTMQLDLTPYDWVVGISDVDLVGHPDLVVRNRTTKQLMLIPGYATGKGFGTPIALGSGFGIYDSVG